MPRALWIIIIGMVVNVTGGSFLWPLNTIYLHEHLGKSMSVAGFVLMLNAAASVIGNLAGGYFFDKLGGYKSIVFGSGITLAALIGITFWHEFMMYTVFLIIIGFGSGVVNPAMYALAGAAWKEGGRKPFNAMYVAANLGVAVGTAMGGFIASISFELIFVSNMMLYFIFFATAFFFFKNISEDTVASVAVSKAENKLLTKENKRGMTALLILSTGYALCWIAYVQWQSTIATYTQEINISLEQYSLLWTVNGALIVLAQPLLAKFIKRFAKTVKLQILIGLAIFFLAFSAASVSTAFIGFLAAMIIMTFGEMLVWPAIPTVADSLAPKGKAGMFQGIVNSAATVGRMVGPLFGGILVDLYGMNVLFICLLFLFGIAAVTTILYDRGLKKEEQPNTMSF
ncbi:MFS transporter [Caldibacillus lycopersici]|uniref:MFS transporter n=1 Tax=Perspicuibacillus lycopersici TaxID=1325689 RepID=A0AAE3IU82_9BACI|nr:MFS transporter [Perspicuibacillus lycopersici]MCU9614267.1 MFS transporter [Perspicuibacillus lycopersici]